MGKVYLIGAGPGDPELLTVKAARLLRQALIVLHDSLVSREVLALIPPTAEVIDVGKRCGQKLLTQDEINALLVSYAANNSAVIRLKGGDPLIFGRAGEEIEALRQAGVAFEVVPGITAALGAAAAANVSLTDRRAASQVVIATFSRGSENSTLNWAAVTSNTTLVLYMPGADYAEVANRMRDAGLAGRPAVRHCFERDDGATTNPSHDREWARGAREAACACAADYRPRRRARRRTSRRSSLAGRHVPARDSAVSDGKMEGQL